MPKQDQANEGYKILHRSSTNRVLAGVAGGLGEYFDIDPTIIRIVFIILTVFGGSGILIYLVLWLVMPGDSSSFPKDHIKKGVAEMKETFRSFSHDIREGSGPSERRAWFGFLILLVGLLFLSNNFGFFGFYSLGRFWPLIIIVLGLLLLYRK